MAVKLELYRVFKEVAETGNISAAAKNLYISQSAVSQSIKQLETALQARLFARSPRGVTLTGEGQMLYQYVRNALGLLATGEDKLSQAQQLLLGTLTIGGGGVCGSGRMGAASTSERCSGTASGAGTGSFFSSATNYSSASITLTGQFSAESRAPSFSSSEMGVCTTSALPSAARPKTAGQVETHSPQPMQPS